MQILTLPNTPFPLNTLPDYVDKNIRYAILDNCNPHEPDFFFPPLVLLESFNSPAIVLKIGNDIIELPIDWCLVIGDSSASAHMEVLPLSSLTDAGFNAFVFNPVSSFRMDFIPINIIGFKNDAVWFLPKLKQNHLMAVPLTSASESLCIYIAKSVTRVAELIHLDKLL